MHTLPFMHQTHTPGSEGRIRSSSDTNAEKSSERASFEPAMRDARSKNTAVRKNSSQSERDQSDVVARQHKQPRRDEDLAGAANTTANTTANSTNNRGSEDKDSHSRLNGTRADSTSSNQARKGSEESVDVSVRSGQSENSLQESEFALTGAQNEKLQQHLKAVIQILEQTPAGSEIAAELQDILNGFEESASISDSLPALNLSESQAQALDQLLQNNRKGASISESLPALNLSESQAQALDQLVQSNRKGASISESLPALNLSESQAQALDQLLQSNRKGASISESLPALNLSESQAQKLQDILVTLKNANNESFPDSSMQNNQQLKGKLTELLAQVEHTLHKAQQGSQVQNTVAQLRQPEIVDGFVLRAEQDKNAFNSASKIDDPRFAALLNKSTEFSSLRERQGQSSSAKGDMLSVRMSGMNPQEQAQSLMQQARTEMATSNTGTNGETGKGLLETQVQMMPGNASITEGSSAEIMGMKGLAESAVVKDNAGVDFSAAQKGTGIGAGSNDPGIMTLKNGATMPTARVVDQTIQHLNLHARGDSSVVTVKLYPEELGELNIRMVMEGDQLKLQIQAQNQQVREILEQNFPRLRTAMEDQGVTVEDFQVSLGDSRAEDQAGTHGDDELPHRRQAGDGASSVAGVDSGENEDTEPSSGVATGSGLSVHV